VTIRLRERRLASYKNEVAFDLLVDIAVDGRRTSRYLSSIRQSRVSRDDVRAEFWRRARSRLEFLGIALDEEVPDRVTKVIPLDAYNADGLSKVYAKSEAR
jgi:hypothetical protein